MRFRATKNFGQEAGLSAVFRQHRATSHCAKLHGYAMGVRIEFGADELDANNWVYDFGNCKWIKAFLQDTFDHKLVVASDDPHLSVFRELDEMGFADLVVLPAVGCESFARYVFDFITEKLKHESSRVSVLRVDVYEHQGNQASVCKT